MGRKKTLKDVGKSRVSPPRESPRKKHQPDQLDFSDSNSLVALIAGKDKVKFTVHKEVICYHSPILATALNSTLTEGTTQTYVMDDINPETISAFLKWIYFQKIKKVGPQTDDETFAQTIVSLWLLADRLMVPRLQNLAIKKLDELYNESDYFHIKGLHEIYEKTDKTSLLRQYFVNILDGKFDVELLENDADLLPREFLLDLLKFRMNGYSGYPLEDFFVHVEDDEADEME